MALMTQQCAAGETKSAMRTTLHLDGYGDEEVNAYYKKLKRGALEDRPVDQLSIANAIFTNQLVNITRRSSRLINLILMPPSKRSISVIPHRGVYQWLGRGAHQRANKEGIERTQSLD